MSEAKTVLAASIKEIVKDDTLNAGVAMMRTRERDFPSKQAMHMTGIAMMPDARRRLDQSILAHWLSNDPTGLSTTGVDEVIIGGGLHAAIYAAIRSLRQGYPKPLVLEASATPGGTFACTTVPTFYLNSRNRPGPLGEPGSNRGLNVIPGGVIQPASLSTAEYQTNADMAFAIRMTLAEYADVRPCSKVTSVERTQTARRRYRVETDGDSVVCDRVIDARGMGEARVQQANFTTDGRTTMTFPEFMQRMESVFPLQGMRRVAVVGDGDSAKCAVEALIGIGPGEHMSVPELDYVEQIDWYAPKLPSNCPTWRETVRGRYRRIGSYLRRSSLVPGRIEVIQAKGFVQQGYECASVNEKPYDAVIACTGQVRPRLQGLLANLADSPFYLVDGVSVGRKMTDDEVYRIGACAEIPFTAIENEAGINAIPENIAAIFRLAGRTATFANTLMAPQRFARSKRSRPRRLSENEPLPVPTGAIFFDTGTNNPF